jgi:hypothetical protein
MIGYELRDHENSNSKLHSQEGEVVFSDHIFEGLFDPRVGGKGYNVFSAVTQEIAFRGTAHILDAKNDFVFPILRAAASTFSTLPDYS